MERYRTRIYLYGHDLLTAQFIEFLRTEDLVLVISFDSTPMRIFSEDRRAGSVEVFAVSLEARGIGGKTIRLFPKLRLPATKSAAWILSVLSKDDMFITQFVESGAVKILMLNCDGANANKAAIRLLTSELSIYPNLLVLSNICAAHTINNSSKWGLGDFPYGEFLRHARVFGAVRKRNIPDLVKKLLVGESAPSEHLVAIRDYCTTMLSIEVTQPSKIDTIPQSVIRPGFDARCEVAGKRNAPYGVFRCVLYCIIVLNLVNGASRRTIITNVMMFYTFGSASWVA